MSILDRLFGRYDGVSRAAKAVTQADVEAAPVPDEEIQQKADLGRLLLDEQAHLASAGVASIQRELARGALDDWGGS